MELPINASGIIWNEQAKKPPLAAEALDAVKGETVAAKVPWVGEEIESGHTEQSERNLVHLTQSEDALVLNSVLSLIFLIFLRLGKGKPVLMFGEKPALQPGATSFLEKLAKRSGATMNWLNDTAGHEAKGNNSYRKAAFVMSLEQDGKFANSSVGATGDITPVTYARKMGIPAVKLLQNATLLDLSAFGLPAELQVKQWVQEGYDLVVFGGDRMVGGPSAGIAVGLGQYISLLKKELLASAFAPGEIHAAVLEATLKLYFQREKALQQIPLLRTISVPLSDLQERAKKLSATIEREFHGLLETRMVEGETRLLEKNPGLALLPTYQVELLSAGYSSRHLYHMMRSRGYPPVLAQLKQNRLFLDLRSMSEEDDKRLVSSLKLTWKRKESEYDVLERTPALIWVVDRQGNFLYANRACERFWGTDARGLPGKAMSDVSPVLAEHLQEKLEEVLDNRQESSQELFLESAEGKSRCFEIVLTPVFDQQDEVKETTCTAYEITGLKRMEEELKQISMHDSLTGLYNRAYFEEEMRRLDAHRHYPVSIVVFDVDGLKIINDILGHKQGDELIKDAATIIKKPFRTSDVVARVGGDEFAVILPSTSEKTTEQICQRLKAALQEYNRNNIRIPLRLSIGYATGEEPGEMISIFEKADQRMYQDKFEHADTVRQKFYEVLIRKMWEKDFMDENGLRKLERLVFLLCRSMGFNQEEVDLVSLLAQIYDIGKISVDDRIIFKQGTLTPAEWEEIKKHPETGYRIASLSPEMKPVADYILQHHEYWDGSGYPRGLKGANIHLYARIMAVVDAYSAMTSPRPYREALTHDEAMQELVRMKGVQFDPRLVDIFVSLVDMEINAMKEIN